MSIEDAEETRENLYSGCGCRHGKIEVPTAGTGRWVEKLAQAVPVKSHAGGMFAKCKISASGDFAALAGAWGVPSQRFRISEKDILKHCWLLAGSYQEIVLLETAEKIVE